MATPGIGENDSFSIKRAPKILPPAIQTFLKGFTTK